MAGLLHVARIARMAHGRVATARELETRFKALPPEQQAEARKEWDDLKAALKAVRVRLESGPRGFARELQAGYRGEETEPQPDPRPLGELARELHAASGAMRNKLDAVEAASGRVS